MEITIYDRNGLRIGYTEMFCPSSTQIAPGKPSKKAKPAKSAKTAAPAQPDFQLSTSDTNLLDFLQGEC